MKLMIAVPSLDFMHTEFVKSLCALTKRLSDDGILYEVVIQSGTLVYVARDNLAHHAADGDYTHVLWLDSDMVFTEDLVDDLLFSERRMVCGIFHGRRPPHLSCLFRSLDPLDRFTAAEYPEDVFEIGGCGFGAVLMEADVLREVFANCGTCFAPTHRLGEDLAFCQRVALTGIKMYADPRVRVGHIGHITIWPEDEDRFIQQVVGGIECLNASKRQ